MSEVFKCKCCGHYKVIHDPAQNTNCEKCQSVAMLQKVDSEPEAVSLLRECLPWLKDATIDEDAQWYSSEAFAEEKRKLDLLISRVEKVVG